MRKYLIVIGVTALLGIAFAQTVEFSSTSPAAPTDYTNIHFQTNTGVTPPLISAYVPTPVQFVTGARPPCTSATPGYPWYVAGGTGVKDTFSVCAKDASDVWAWRALY